MPQDDHDNAAAQQAARAAASIDATELGERIGLRACEVVSELRDRFDDDLQQATIRAAMSNVEAVLRGFAEQGLPGAAQASDATLNWVSGLARRGISAAAIPQCYVIGQGLCDLALREAVLKLNLPADLADTVRWQLVNAASRYLFGFTEKIAGDLVEHYEKERELWVRDPDSVRTETVRNILEGRHFDGNAARSTLNYDLSRRHVAVVVWGDARGKHAPPTGALKQGAQTVAHALGGTDVLVVPATSSMVWAWATGPAVTDQPAQSPSLDPAMSAAVGSLADGVHGFIQSHGQARDARRTASVFGYPAGSVVRFRDIALDALLTRDLAAVGQFVTGELGELSSPSERSRRLRTTLIAFFEEGMSWSKTAERLGVHQNTVQYRVAQAKDLLGRPLTDRRLELEVALRLAEAGDNVPIGADALDAPGDRSSTAVL